MSNVTKLSIYTDKISWLIFESDTAKDNWGTTQIQNTRADVLKYLTNFYTYFKELIQRTCSCTLNNIQPFSLINVTSQKIKIPVLYK